MTTLYPCPGEPGPGLGAGAEGWRWAPAPASLRQSARRQPPVPAPPGAAAERLCPLLQRCLGFFFSLSSAIFPLQSIAGNRMWVTQQHCFRLRKLPLLLPKGSGGTRGCRGGCRSPAATGSAQGPGSRCSPSHVPKDRGSCLGPLRLSQPLEGAVLRGGTRNKEGSANFTPESRQLQRRKVRRVAALVGPGGDAGTRSAQAGWEGSAGRDPCFHRGGFLAGAWALSAPLPFCRVPLSGWGMHAVRSQGPLCLSPWAEGTRRLLSTRDAAAAPGFPASHSPLGHPHGWKCA